MFHVKHATGGQAPARGTIHRRSRSAAPDAPLTPPRGPLDPRRTRRIPPRPAPLRPPATARRRGGRRCGAGNPRRRPRRGRHVRGKAQAKTWTFAILKNKIVDHIRQRVREPTLNVYDDEIPDDAFDALFDERRHWKPSERPASWGDPEQSLEDAQFWRVFDACLERLPSNTARVFMMREFLGFETDEICKELALSASNCWVILHRARMALRLCLESQWFQGKT